MQAKVTKLPKSRVRLTIEVPAKEIKPVLERIFEEFAQNIEVTGFRSGHAPRAMVIERVGLGKIQQEVLNHVLNMQYADALKMHKMIPVSQPAISIDSFSIAPDGASSTDLKTTIEVDILPSVSLTGYKSIKVKQPKLQEISDDDVQKVVDHLRRQKANLKDIDLPAQAGRPAKLGDWVDISFKGLLNGVPQEKLSSDHHPVVLGSNVMVSGFENKLVGSKKGQKKHFELTFPKDYFATEFAGKTVKFEVIVNDLKQVELPAPDSQFASNFGHGSIDSLKAAIRESLDKENTRKHQGMIESAAIEAALKKFKAELPESLVESELDRIIERIKEDVEKQGMPLAIYLEKIKKTPVDLRIDFRLQAEHNVKVGLMLGEVVNQEKMDTNREDIARKALDKLVEYATR